MRYMRTNTKNAICGICPAGCWVTVTFDEKGRIKDVGPDESSHLGMICKLGEHSADIVYSEHRLKYPLRRKGPKGRYDFERISWDEAMDEIVKNLQRIKAESGPEATAIYTGRGSFERAMCDIYQPQGVAVSSASSVLFPFGSPNTLGVGALCYVSFAMIAPHVTMGGMMINMFSDIEHANLILVWGSNPATDSPPLDYQRIMEARQRGAEVVVIDPRRTKTAKDADAEWIPVRPGTDGALALALCNTLIAEELYDESFVENWTHGFHDFSRYVQHFRPETVETSTGVPAETIRSLARHIASADGAVPVMYTGLEYSNSGVQAIRATMTLWALAGQLDVPGGRCFSMPGSEFPINREGHISNPDENKALGRDRFPVYSSYRGESHAIALPNAVLHGDPYKIRALIILGGSIITAWPKPDIWKKTFNALDFLVCIDRQLTADAAYADIVLPATTMYEIESYMTYGSIFRIREKVIDPVAEARNDFFVMAELADRLGYGDLFPQNEEALLRHVLKPSGYTLEQIREAGGIVQLPTEMMQYKKWEKGLLRPNGRPGFDTPTGKFEIASSILQENGYEPLPEYTEPLESPESRPDLSKDYPLIFNSGSRVTTDFRSQHHGIKKLADKRPEPLVTINSKDAVSRGITGGDMVTIRTPRGKLTMRAFVTDDIMPGAIDADMGGGGPVGPEAWQKTNINELTDLENYDPISGFPVYKSLLCDVELTSSENAKVTLDSGEGTIRKEVKRKKISVKRIYLDHNATTPMDPQVWKAMQVYIEQGQGNASSIYHEGKAARFAIENSRRSVARLLNCTARRIVFTGGGSEANNLALKGIAFKYPSGNKHIIISAIEHPAILNTCKWLEGIGFNITYLPVDSDGLVNPADLKKVLRRETILVSIMTANNETGVIQPVEELAEICHRHGCLFHTDAVQAAGKIKLDVSRSKVDMMTISGHKFYGPKGIGVLYISKDVDPEPLVHGGKQENALRAGTENAPGIIGMGKAADLAVRRLSEMTRVAKLRDMLENGIRNIFPEARRNGHPGRRVPVTLNMTFPGIRGESFVLALDQKGIAISSGSACRAGSPDPSHALLEMGLSETDAHCSIRLSLGYHTTRREIDRTLQCMDEVINDSRAMVRFIPCR
jgi:cysteine desulfurase NifS